MIKKIIAATGIAIFSLSAIAGTNYNLTAESSWDDILKSKNIEVTGKGIIVGATNTNVFFTEVKGDTLYTKKPTKDGYYKKVNSANDGFKRVWVETGESIKSGPVANRTAVYKEVKNGKNDLSLIELKTVDNFLGYEYKPQKLTRILKVYEVKENSNGNKNKRFLFKKEYTVTAKS